MMCKVNILREKMEFPLGYESTCNMIRHAGIILSGEDQTQQKAKPSRTIVQLVATALRRRAGSNPPSASTQRGGHKYVES